VHINYVCEVRSRKDVPKGNRLSELIALRDVAEDIYPAIAAASICRADFDDHKAVKKAAASR